MSSATPEQLKAAGVKTTDTPALLIEAFSGDWQKEWFTYDLSGDWARKTHKLYDPQWQAPALAKLALEVRAEKPNKLVVGLDSTAAAAQLLGGPEWQSLAFCPADFHRADGTSLVDWKGIKELRLGGKEMLYGNKDGEEKRVVLGADWQGAKSEFRNLRWVQGP